MMKNKLEKEIKKWFEKIKKIDLEVKSEKGEWIKENVLAYVKDSEYFFEKGDLIRAFECVIWAWAFVEIGKELGKIKVRCEK